MSSKYHVPTYEYGVYDGYGTENTVGKRIVRLEEKMHRVEQMVEYLLIRETDPERAAKILAELYGVKNA